MENLLNNVKLLFDKNTEAAVHNHPRSNPPSISDVLTLAKMNKRSDGKFESSFIVSKTGPIYVLQVTDKAYNFYELYTPQVIPAVHFAGIPSHKKLIPLPP